MATENKKTPITLINEALDTKSVSGVVALSRGTYMGFLTTEETEKELLKGTRFLQLIDALSDPEFYQKARLKFDDLGDIYYVYDNSRVRALAGAINKTMESLGIEDETTN